MLLQAAPVFPGSLSFERAATAFASSRAREQATKQVAQRKEQD